MVTVKSVGATPPLVATCICVALNTLEVPAVQAVLLTLPITSLPAAKLYGVVAGDISATAGVTSGSVVNMPLVKVKLFVTVVEAMSFTTLVAAVLLINKLGIEEAPGVRFASPVPYISNTPAEPTPLYRPVLE